MSSVPALDDLIWVTGMPKSGTVYYTNWLNSQGYTAKHEYIYSGRPERDPVPGQTHEVGFWSMAKGRGDVLLVRDPRKCIPSVLRRLKPTFHMWTHQHLGFHPHTIDLMARAWYEWNEIVLGRGASVLRLEDVPRLPLADNRDTRGTHKPLTWSQLPKSVRDMASDFGYSVLE